MKQLLIFAVFLGGFFSLPSLVQANDAECISSGGNCQQSCTGYIDRSTTCTSVRNICCLPQERRGRTGSQCVFGSCSGIGGTIGCIANCSLLGISGQCIGGSCVCGAPVPCPPSGCPPRPACGGGGGGGGGGGAPAPPPRYNITGHVFFDNDRNQNKNNNSIANDTWANGITVRLSGAGSGTRTTSGNGDFTFNGYLAGNYAVTVSLPAGYVNTSALRRTVTLGPNRANIDFGIVQIYSIGGDVFNDLNKNRIQDTNNGVMEPNILTGITIDRAPASGAIFVNQGSGQYTINNLYAGTYTVRYRTDATPIPNGYFLIYPLNGPPPQHRISVGPNCNRDIGLSFGAQCVNGSVTNADFAISNSIPWFQTYGFDVRIDEGFEDKIPINPLYPRYASVSDSINGNGGLSETTYNTGVITCTSGGQLCNQKYTRTISTKSVLLVNFSTPAFCSSTRVHFFVDNVEKDVSEWLGWSGAPSPYNTYPLNTGIVDLGSITAGNHTLGLQLEGRVSGCNTGTLGSWAGNVSVTTD